MKDTCYNFIIFFCMLAKYLNLFWVWVSEFETLTNAWCCVVDVLALAASIGELTTLCRKARTANWCALQMADKDNAPLTSLGFEIKTEMTKEGFPVYISQQNVIELQDTEEGQSGENSKAWVTSNIRGEKSGVLPSTTAPVSVLSVIVIVVWEVVLVVAFTSTDLSCL